MLQLTRSTLLHRVDALAARTCVATAAFIALGACGDGKPKGTGPYADLVSDALPKIEQHTGLTYKKPPTLATKSHDEVAQFVMKQLTSARATSLIDGQQSSYRVLGMIPDTMNLAALLQKLLEEQIIGFYDPATKVLYVVEGAPKALIQQTVTHELVHALQDQYINVDSIQNQTADADRQASAQAILEGHAIFVQFLADPNLGPILKMPGGWDRIRDLIRDGQGSMPVFASAPRAVREGLLFPYLGGADFVRRFSDKRPLKEILTDLPVSTKQILNDAAYFTATPAARDVPTAVTLPVPSSGTVIYSNSFGEFETRLILVQHLRDESLARRGAAGIDGDKYAVIRTQQGDALVWASVWDTSVDAIDFQDLLADAIRKRYEMAKPTVPPGATSRRLDVAASKTHGARTVTISLEQRDGRAVVLFMDTPAGTSPTLIDRARVTIGH